MSIKNATSHLRQSPPAWSPADDRPISYELTSAGVVVACRYDAAAVMAFAQARAMLAMARRGWLVTA